MNHQIEWNPKAVKQLLKIPRHNAVKIKNRDYRKLSRQLSRDDENIPHEVVSYMVDNDCSIVKAWRVYLKKTQQQVAGRMGITQGSYSSIENSRTNQKATLKKLAAALEISPSQLDVHE